MKKIAAVLLFLILLVPARAQDDFYHAGTIRDIRIFFREPGWRQLLDSLFENLGDEGKLAGDVTIDGILYRNAGIRYKGYSSYNPDEIKNPFNIDLDYRVKNQNHQGFVKVKLSNVIQDPSFIREALSYEIARKYLPAPHANFATLYVNDTLIGLYTNVEAVNEKFVGSRYGSDDHSFFKGEPLKLVYPFGENANLALTHGSDSTAYTSFYNMESEYGWSDLYDLINRLDRGAASADSVLNTDRALWMHAFNEVLVNLDSYIGYAQNYYLYRDDNGRFNPIIWDLNMSFGSFRESDGARHFLGLTIPQCKTLDPLALTTFSVSPRPLMTKLFANDTLKKMYLAHMRTLLDENFRNGWYYARGKELTLLIDTAVQADTNRFYSYEDFLANLDTTVGGTGGMKQYPGIKELMSARMKYLDGLSGFSGQPVISDPVPDPAVPRRGDSLWIAAQIEGGTLALLGYRCRKTDRFTQISLSDDGLHHDRFAGDGIFGAGFPVTGYTAQYYIYAQNDSAGTFSPPRAEYEFHTVQPETGPGDMVVNEVRAGSMGNHWIELLNTTSEPLQVSGMRITGTDAAVTLATLPDTVVPAKRFLLVTPVTRASAGETTVKLFNAPGALVDSVCIGESFAGKSSGRYPNGYGPVVAMEPTPGNNNFAGTTPADGFLIYPNPAQDAFAVEMMNAGGTIRVTVCNALGVQILEKRYFYPAALPRAVTLTFNSGLPAPGLYLVRVSGEAGTCCEKLIIQ